MELIDIILLCILAIPALVGLMYGFLNILFSLLAWLVAAGVAINFSSTFEPMLSTYINATEIRYAVTFIALFIVSLLVFSILGYFIVKLLGRSGLTAADRLLGLLFGCGLGAAIIALGIFFAGFTAFPQENWWQQSKLIRPFQMVALWARQYLPDNLAKYHSYDNLVVIKPGD